MTRHASRAAADDLIARGHRAEAAGDLAAACVHYRCAVALDPDHPGAHLNLGIGLAASGDDAGAIACYERAMALDPRHPAASYNLAIAVQARGEFGRAEALLRQALSAQPEFPDAHIALANALDALGRRDEAVSALRAALALAPDHAGAWNNLGEVLATLGQAGEAIACYRRAVAAAPGYAEAWDALGKLLHGRGEVDAAGECFRRVVAIRPDGAAAHNNLGAVLHLQGRLDEARACYRAALAIQPDNAESWCNLGSIHLAQRHLEESAECYRRAIAIRPGFADAHYNLGCALDHEEALPHYERALALAPDHTQARWGAAMSLSVLAPRPGESPDAARARFAEALVGLDAWFDERRIDQGHRAVGSRQPFHVAYREGNNRALLGRYGQLCARLMKHWQDSERLWPRPRSAGSVLSVGIVSAHLFDHSVWIAILRGWFRHLDPALVALHVFYTGIKVDDETRFAQSRAQSFTHEMRDLRQWVEAMLAKSLDVIVYPEIGMDSTCLKLASLRLAPVQAASWGHPETTGLPTIDYYLSAEDLEPPGGQDNYTERLVTLPQLGCCYAPLAVTPAAVDLAALGIATDRPRLLCPGTPYKYAPEHDDVFVRIARELRQCQFVFSTHQQEHRAERLRLRLASAFARAGLDFGDFAVFLPWQPRPAFYGLMGRMDVFLDTIGFSGFNTAMQAIECGLPIVTVEGDYLRGRLASGILRRMGLPELVTESDEAFVAKVVELVRDAALRQRLRSRIAAARGGVVGRLEPIRALEDFLFTATRRCAGLRE